MPDPKIEPGASDPPLSNRPVNSNMGGLALIPTYNGSRDSSLKFKDFIEIVEQVSELESWTDERKLGALKLALRGEAKYLVRGEQPTTYQDAKKLLEDNFTYHTSLASALPLLTQPTQRQKESARMYLQRLLGIRNKVLDVFTDQAEKDNVTKLVEDALIATLRRTVRPDRIKTKLIAANLKQLSDAKKLISQAERDEQDYYPIDKGIFNLGQGHPSNFRDRHNGGTSNFRPRNDFSRPPVKDRTNIFQFRQNNANQQSRNSRDFAKTNVAAARTHDFRQCYSCGKTGHLARECRAAGPPTHKPKGPFSRQMGTNDRHFNPQKAQSMNKCYRCGGNGHFANTCTATQCYRCNGFFHVARNCTNKAQHPSTAPTNNYKQKNAPSS